MAGLGLVWEWDFLEYLKLGGGGGDPSVVRCNGRVGSGSDPNQSFVADTDDAQLPLGCPCYFLT